MCNNSYWTEQTVLEELKKNPYFEDLTKEYEGRKSACYVIGGILVIVFNTVGGHAEVFFGSYNPDADVKSAQEFARIAKEIVQREIDK